MEILVLGACLIGVIWLAYQFRDKEHRSSPGKTDRSHVKPHVPVRHTKPRPFDQSTAKEPPPPASVKGFARIIDGDSIVIKKTQIRLFGIDAPEIDHPYGQKAKWALVRLCKGHAVRAEIQEIDAHGRTVAKCYLEDGRDLSEEMVKLGLAIDWPKFSGGKYRHLEVADARKKMWLADARQKGRMHVWEKFEAKNGKSR